MTHYACLGLQCCCIEWHSNTITWAPRRMRINDKPEEGGSITSLKRAGFKSELNLNGYSFFVAGQNFFYLPSSTFFVYTACCACRHLAHFQHLCALIIIINIICYINFHDSTSIYLSTAVHGHSSLWKLVFCTWASQVTERQWHLCWAPSAAHVLEH